MDSNCDCSSVVEHRSNKPGVEGSNPSSRIIIFRNWIYKRVTHYVEYIMLGNVEMYTVRSCSYIKTISEGISILLNNPKLRNLESVAETLQSKNYCCLVCLPYCQQNKHP